MNGDREREEFWRIVADLQAGDRRLARLARGRGLWRTGGRIGLAVRVALLITGMGIMLVGVSVQHVEVGVAGFLVMLAAVGGSGLMPDSRRVSGRRGLHRGAAGPDANKLV